MKRKKIIFQKDRKTFIISKYNIYTVTIDARITFDLFILYRRYDKTNARCKLFFSIVVCMTQLFYYLFILL